MGVVGAAMMVGACGGFGSQAWRLVQQLVGDRPGLRWRVLDTEAPDWVPPGKFIDLAPHELPREPRGVVAEALAMTGVSLEQYQRYVELVGAEGLAQLPAMSWIASMVRMPQLVEAVERDMRAASRACDGADSGYVLTVASLLGGTGGPSARALGYATRIAARGDALPANTQWWHVVLTGSVLGDSARTQRTRAIERRQLDELRALMHPDAHLRLPRYREAVRAGPDKLLLLASSAATPRTLEQACEELAEIVRQVGSTDGGVA